jgi:hypothetical protein
MKNILRLLLLFSTQCFGQTTTVSIVAGWNAVVTLPANYYTTANPVNTIIFFPGLGEVGTDVAALRSNGPTAFLDAGGKITGDPIVISLQPPAAYPHEDAMNTRIQTLKSLYRIGKICLTGLSHGGWCSSTFVTGDPYGGPYIYANQIACVVTVEGVIPNDNSPYPNLFDNFSKNGGKYLGFEQTQDFRDTKTVVDRMNLTVPNSAVYIQTNFGGGGHCCWSSFYGGQGTQPSYFSEIGGTMYDYIQKAFAGNCNTDAPKTYYLGHTAPGEIYRPNGSQWKGGDTVMITETNYSTIEFYNVGGDTCRPLVIKAQSPLFSKFILFKGDAHYIKLLGAGMKCNVYTVSQAHNIYAKKIECSNGSIGVFMRFDIDSTDARTWYPNYDQHDNTIDSFYVHDVPGEGMYIGDSQPTGYRYKSPYTGKDTILYPIRLRNTTVSNCLVERTGWDGIQVSNATDSCNVFGNEVRNYGLLNVSQQKAGIIMGGNTSGNCFNNYVHDGPGNGIQFFGYGMFNCYGNKIANAGEQSIYSADYKVYPEGRPIQTINIYNNTIINPVPAAIELRDDNGNIGISALTNNLFCISNAAANWKSSYIKIPGGYTDVNNTLCGVLALDTIHTPTQQQQSLQINYSNGIISFRSTIVAPFTIYDMYGRAIIKSVYNAGSVRISVSMLPAGMYIFKTQNKYGYPIVKKIIK